MCKSALSRALTFPPDRYTHETEHPSCKRKHTSVSPSFPASTPAIHTCRHARRLNFRSNCCMHRHAHMLSDTPTHACTHKARTYRAHTFTHIGLHTCTHNCIYKYLQIHPIASTHSRAQTATMQTVGTLARTLTRTYHISCPTDARTTCIHARAQARTIPSSRLVASTSSPREQDVNYAHACLLFYSLLHDHLDARHHPNLNALKQRSSYIRI